MREFTAIEKKRPHSVNLITPHILYEAPKLYAVTVKEDSVSDNLNVRIGERYPITVKIEPSGIEYNDFTINDDSYVRVYNSSGGRISTVGNMVIDNTLKTITYIWDTSPHNNPPIFNSPQQYTVIIWASISYVTAEGEVIDTLISSDNITKNLIRSSRLE